MAESIRILGQNVMQEFDIDIVGGTAAGANKLHALDGDRSSLWTMPTSVGGDFFHYVTWTTPRVMGQGLSGLGILNHNLKAAGCTSIDLDRFNGSTWTNVADIHMTDLSSDFDFAVNMEGTLSGVKGLRAYFRFAAGPIVDVHVGQLYWWSGGHTEVLAGTGPATPIGGAYERPWGELDLFGGAGVVVDVAGHWSQAIELNFPDLSAADHAALVGVYLRQGGHPFLLHTHRQGTGEEAYTDAVPIGTNLEFRLGVWPVSFRAGGLADQERQAERWATNLQLRRQMGQDEYL